MFLLILRGTNDDNTMIDPLHSTMFLLIPILILVVQVIHLPLHSTMFLLIHEKTAREKALEEFFTFHNVSINTSLWR